MKKISILFVCLGNICRSPMAEMIMRHLVHQKELSDVIHIESAGTAGWHQGETMHCGTQDILERNLIPILPFKSQKITKNALEKFDFIAVMDSQNLHDVETFLGEKNERIFLLTDFCDDADKVPDPWYDGRFDRVYDIITQCCTNWLEQIIQKYF